MGFDVFLDLYRVDYVHTEWSNRSELNRNSPQERAPFVIHRPIMLPNETILHGFDDSEQHR